MNSDWKRPQTAAEVCSHVYDSETFGRNVRDWQHELKNIHSRSEFARRVAAKPPLLRSRLEDYGQCDAYLAAYVEWLCDSIGIDSPEWTQDPRRIADRAWYDYPPLWQQSFVQAPGAFRRRKIFTRPENVLTIRPGRPRVSRRHKQQKNADRQRRYRQRIQEKLQRLKALESRSR